MTTQIIGRIYKITSSECEGVYIGSTTHQLKTRFSKHKSDYKRYLDGRSNTCYITSFEIIKHADAKIELILEGIFDDHKDLGNIEGEIIRTTSYCVNKIICGRTIQEYIEDNKDRLNEKHMCPICNSQYRYRGKSNHLKSPKHLNAMYQLSHD